MSSSPPSILSLHACNPEVVIVEWLRDNLPFTDLKERGIHARAIQGHPLYPDEPNQEGEGSMLPAIGVDWVTDHPGSYIGGGFSEFYPTERWRTLLNNYRQLPLHGRSASDRAVDELASAAKIQSWHQHVESRVVVCGFASGGNGRQVARILYGTVLAAIPVMCHDIAVAIPGVKVYLPEQSSIEVSVTIDGIAGDPVGFELALSVQQMKRTFRTVPAELWGSDKWKFDIFYSNSRTEFGPPPSREIQQATDSLFNFKT